MRSSLGIERFTTAVVLAPFVGIQGIREKESFKTKDITLVGHMCHPKMMRS
jgi:hypothetical protein